MTRVRLAVAPGAARSEIVGRYGDAWKVRVAAPAERGRANAMLLDLLADALLLPRGHLAVVAGESSQRKVVAVDGLDADETARRLEAAARDR